MLALLMTTLVAVDPVYREPPQYPWEERFLETNPRISIEFFRCKGNRSHPIRGEGTEKHADCGGDRAHGLPLLDNKEFVYPVLVDLLNWVQQKAEKKVVVTCGHCCPTHNTYLDPSPDNATSKHQIAAEVDFYVKGLEGDPQKVVDLLLAYYADKPEMGKFERYTKGETNVRVQPWSNKEVFIKLFHADEGRDLDNSHGYPYISIQVRWDRDKNERVVYNWNTARQYLRR